MYPLFGFCKLHSSRFVCIHSLVINLFALSDCPCWVHLCIISQSIFWPSWICSKTIPWTLFCVCTLKLESLPCKRLKGLYAYFQATFDLEHLHYYFRISKQVVKYLKLTEKSTKKSLKNYAKKYKKIWTNIQNIIFIQFYFQLNANLPQKRIFRKYCLDIVKNEMGKILVLQGFLVNFSVSFQYL